VYHDDVADAVHPPKRTHLDPTQKTRHRPFVRKRVVRGEYDYAPTQPSAGKEEHFERYMKSILKMNQISSANCLPKYRGRREHESQVVTQFGQFTATVAGRPQGRWMNLYLRIAREFRQGFVIDRAYEMYGNPLFA
jgi:hypothetical protein